jgi:hypothetical protein
VLVQAGREPGPIAIVATAAGLSPGRLVVQASPAPLRAAVP